MGLPKKCWSGSGPLAFVPYIAIGSRAWRRVHMMNCQVLRLRNRRQLRTAAACAACRRVIESSTSTKTAAPSVNIYINNLAGDTTEEQVTSALSKFGKITKVKLSADRGYSYISFEAEAEAAAAVAAGTVSVNGRDSAVEVRKARAKQPKRPKAKKAGSSGGGKAAVSQDNQLYVKGVAVNVTSEALRVAFGQHDEIEKVLHRAGKNVAFIEYKTAEEVEAAVAAGSCSVGSQIVTVEVRKPKELEAKPDLSRQLYVKGVPSQDRAEVTAQLSTSDGVPHPAASDVAVSTAGRHTCLLVRVHHPTDAAIRRLMQWADQLRASTAYAGGFWVSVDATDPAQGRRTIKRLTAAAAAHRPAPITIGIDLQLHCYTEAEMVAAYPALGQELMPRFRELERKKEGGKRTRQNHASLGWGFHNEAINLWSQRLPTLCSCCGCRDLLAPQGGDATNASTWQCPTPECAGRGRPDDRQQYDHVWVLEDDVGFTGPITQLLDDYISDPTDLIMDGRPPPRPPMHKTWTWRHMVTSKFDARVTSANLVGAGITKGARRRCLQSGGRPPLQRVLAAEHVGRFSHKLLDQLHMLSQRGEIGWSEMASPTLCKVLGLTDKSIDPTHIGPVFAWNGRVEPNAWKQFNKDPDTQGKLFHALKF